METETIKKMRNNRALTMECVGFFKDTSAGRCYNKTSYERCAEEGLRMRGDYSTKSSNLSQSIAEEGLRMRGDYSSRITVDRGFDAEEGLRMRGDYSSRSC